MRCAFFANLLFYAQSDAFWHRFDVDDVIEKRSGYGNFGTLCDGDRFEQRGRLGASFFRIVFKDDDLSGCHPSFACRAVVFEHLVKRFPEQVEVFFAEARIVGVKGVDEAFSNV